MNRSPKRIGRPKKGPEDQAHVRQRLLEAAHELMCERRTIDVPVNDIARQAGVNVALINYYFEGKEGLLLQLALRNQGQYAVALQRLVDGPQPAYVKLALHIHALVRAFRQTPYLQRLHHKILRDSNEQSARECAARLIRPMAEFYRALATLGAADGTLRPVDPMNLYVAVVGACDFLYSGGASLHHGFGVEQVSEDIDASFSEELIAIIMEGLRPEAPPQARREARVGPGSVRTRKPT